MSIVKLIGETSLFSSLDESRLKRVAGLAKVQFFPAGAEVFREGEALSELYLLERGSVKLTMGVRLWSGDATLRSIVSIIDPYGTFGWSSLIDPYRATLSAETTRECTMVNIDAAALREEMDRDCEFGYSVMTALSGLISERLRRIQGTWASARAADLYTAPLKQTVYS